MAHFTRSKTYPLPHFVEAEIGTFCNRRCPWCPNASSPRGQQQHQVEPALWRRLVTNLGRANFHGRFGFHNYNEPLYDPALNARITDARRAMPRAYLVLYTNGDALDRSRLDELAAMGVNEVRVTRYPPARTHREPPRPEELERYLRRLQLDARSTLKQKTRKLQWRRRLGSLLLVVNLPLIKHYTPRQAATDRCEQRRRPYQRRRPCWMPLQAASVDYLGNVKLCCHIFDAQDPACAPYLLGNLNDKSFTQIWRSRRATMRRAQLAAADYRELPWCAQCQHKMVPAMQRFTRAHFPIPSPLP